MTEVSVFRLNLLRCGYLLLAVGLGLTIWPEILDPSSVWQISRGEVVCMLGALGLVSVLGLRHPLRMLPVLFFEMAWKSIWMLRIALPLFLAHRMDVATARTAFACAIAVVFPFVIPWAYVRRHYLIRPADPWLRRTA